MKIELKSNVLLVRDLEDVIRATRKYTKGAFRAAKPQQPIQGEQFPSPVLTEYYEVYPDLELSWSMRATDAWAWVWGDVTHIDVVFLYDYRDNKAKVTIHGGEGAVRELTAGIPGFHAALERIKQSEASEDKKKDTGAGQSNNSNTALQGDLIPRPSSSIYRFSLLLVSSSLAFVHMTVKQA